MRKLRTVLLFALSLILAFSLAACGSGSGNTEEEAGTNAVSETEDQENVSEEETTEEETEEKTTVSSVSSADINAVEATLENPAEIGEWVEVLVYSIDDGEYHTAYYRIKEIARGSEVTQAIEEFNEEQGYEYITDPDYEEVEYCLVKYEVYFPEDFATVEWGITNTAVLEYLSVCGYDGADLVIDGTTWVGLGTVKDISDETGTYEIYGGDTFTGGKNIISMVEGYTDYLLKFYYFDDNDEVVYTYVKGE